MTTKVLKLLKIDKENLPEFTFSKEMIDSLLAISLLFPILSLKRIVIGSEATVIHVCTPQSVEICISNDGVISFWTFVNSPVNNEREIVLVSIEYKASNKIKENRIWQKKDKLLLWPDCLHKSNVKE